LFSFLGRRFSLRSDQVSWGEYVDVSSWSSCTCGSFKKREVVVGYGRKSPFIEKCQVYAEVAIYAEVTIYAEVAISGDFSIGWFDNNSFTR
jgi:hypothetical protein